MRRRVPFFAAIIIAISLAPSADAGSLKFSAEVPRPPPRLALLQLAVQPAPIPLLEDFLARSRTPTKLAPLSEAPVAQRNKLKVPKEVFGAFDGDRMRAWVDRRTGEIAMYPDLSRLEPLAQADAEAQLARVREIFGTQAFIARDDTRFVISRPNTLTGQSMARDGGGTVRVERPKAGYLNFFSARRFVGDLPVDGPGSRAQLQIGNGGSVEGITRVWKSAKTVRMVAPSRNTTQVRAEITRQLRYAVKDSDVTVDRIELAYYDANKKFLQPVYRFTAQIHQLKAPEGQRRVNDNFVIGYIPYAEAFEPLPVLGKSSGPMPRTPRKTPKRPQRSGALQIPDDPIVGRYVVRNDDPGWVDSANAFWISLSSFATGPLFVDSQYNWAEARLFTNQKDSFINAMNVVLLEAHGNWWSFTTLTNCCEGVNINGDIPSPGYGTSANGMLAHWILHSCEVVPSPDDTANWADPWWAVFGGLRNAVGYRTIMYIDDGATSLYGASLAGLAPVVSAWLSDVMSLNAYAGNPTSATNDGSVRPMGRPATISACGHDGDDVLAGATLPRADCLTVWWIPD